MSPCLIMIIVTVIGMQIAYSEGLVDGKKEAFRLVDKMLEADAAALDQESPK